MPTMTKAEAIEHLKVERRSFIIGTLVILAVVLVASAYFMVSMYPGLFTMANQQTLGERMAQIQRNPPPPSRQLVLQLTDLIGALALLFLNWRFSFLLRRPRRAFVPAQEGGQTGMRWLWWAVLVLNSFFYNFIVPQLVITWLLARWGSEEIVRQSALPGAGPPPTAPHPL